MLFDRAGMTFIYLNTTRTLSFFLRCPEHVLSQGEGGVFCFFGLRNRLYLVNGWRVGVIGRDELHLKGNSLANVFAAAVDSA